jgi:polysaccharide deacetylase 2 family uncharacterized protein YibQ
VAADDLSAPLGQHKTTKQPSALPGLVAPAVASLLGACVFVFVGWAMLADNPLGGEPVALATAHLIAADTKAGGPTPAPASPGDAVERPSRHDGAPIEGRPPPLQPAPAANTKTVTIIDGSNGKRQEVVIPGEGKAGGPAGEQKFAEASRHGAIPRIADDGTRPADAFARPVKPIPGKPNAPRIAIIVGGLGIGITGTNDAIARLPGAVTLAFAPYGADLDRQAARARDSGHELLVQVPMEPFDYPDNDPGPQTLLTSLDSGQNVDRLQWAMSRFQGYVGIANSMGARFTAAEQSLAAIMRETSKRGLIYLDDGSSPRSLASQIAGANNLAFAKADLIIDAVPTAADIDRALARLEAAARERGSAIGMGSSLPITIDRLAKWAKSAESRGILLVPISAVANRAKSS